eukprot:s832_g10.t1
MSPGSLDRLLSFGVRKLRPLLGPPHRLPCGTAAPPAGELEDDSLAPVKAAADQRWLRHFSGVEDRAPVGRDEHLQACLARQGALGLELGKRDVPTRVELEHSMPRTACNRAAGNDNLPGDIIHLHTASLSKSVYQIFLKVAYRLTEPLHWKGGTLYSVWKKGSQALCSSYRAILVSPSIGKSVHSMMRGRRAEFLDITSTPLQVGGLPGQPVLIAAQAVRSFQALALSRCRSSAVLFIDLKEAFHRVVPPLIHGGGLDDGHIAGIMRALSLPPEAIPRLHEYVRESSLIEAAGSSGWTSALVREFNADAWFNYGTSPDRAAVRAGTRPGDSLADLVFSFLFSEASRRIRNAFDEADIRVLRTAATATIDESVKALLLPNLGPNLGVGKSESIVDLVGAGSRNVRRELFRGSDPSPSLDSELWIGARLRLVPQYKHLGSLLHCAGSLKHEAKARIGAAWAAFRKLKKQVLGSPIVPQRDKALLFTILYFGVGAWPGIAEEQVQHHQTAPVMIARNMLRPHFSFAEACHLSANFALSTARILSAESSFHVERLRHLKAVVIKATPDLWALLRHEGSWLELVQGSIAWMKGRLQAAADPNEACCHWDWAVDSILRKPDAWKGHVRKVRRVALLEEHWRAEVQHFQGLVFRALVRQGARVPTVVRDRADTTELWAPARPRPLPDHLQQFA